MKYLRCGTGLQPREVVVGGEENRAIGAVSRHFSRKKRIELHNSHDIAFIYRASSYSSTPLGALFLAWGLQAHIHTHSNTCWIFFFSRYSLAEPDFSFSANDFHTQFGDHAITSLSCGFSFSILLHEIFFLAFFVTRVGECVSFCFIYSAITNCRLNFSRSKLLARLVASSDRSGWSTTLLAMLVLPKNRWKVGREKSTALVYEWFTCFSRKKSLWWREKSHVGDTANFARGDWHGIETEWSTRSLTRARIRVAKCTLRKNELEHQNELHVFLISQISQTAVLLTTPALRGLLPRILSNLSRQELAFALQSSCGISITKRKKRSTENYEGNWSKRHCTTTFQLFLGRRRFCLATPRARGNVSPSSCSTLVFFWQVTTPLTQLTVLVSSSAPIFSVAHFVVQRRAKGANGAEQANHAQPHGAWN